MRIFVLRIVGLSALFFLVAKLVTFLSANPISESTAEGWMRLPDAQWADLFVDSVGVNIHLGHQGTGYFDRFPEVRSSLRALGVRHVRDDIVGIPDLYESDLIPSRWRALADDGIEILLITESAMPVAFNLDAAAFLEKGLAGLEGPNELDAKGDVNWAALARGYQRELFTEARRRGINVPLLAPSVARPESAAAVGSLSQWSDFGNIHSYPGGRRPLHELDKHLLAAATIAPGLPTIATETGYHLAVANSDGHLPASEEATSRYLPRLLLGYYAGGIARTYLYQLHDEHVDVARRDREQHFGLVDVDFQPKRSFHAVQRLLKLLSDRGPAFTPSSLKGKWRIVGAEKRRLPGDSPIRLMVFQKRSGVFLLLLWSEEESFSQYSRQTLSPNSHRVELVFDDDVEKVLLYRLQGDGRPEQEWLGKQVHYPLDVRDEVMVLEVKPIAGGEG